MQDTSRLETALRNAHNAGDTQAARRLAQEIRRVRGASQQAVQPVSTNPQDMIPTDEPGQGGFITREQANQQAEAMRQRRSAEYGRDLPLAHPVSVQGLAQTFNMSDELVGLAAQSRGLPAGPAAEQERQRVQYRRDTAPLQTAVYEAAAAAPLALLSGGSSLSGAARTGAAFGFAAGAGNGETTQERLGNAAIGGAVGAGVGAAGQAVASGIGRVSSPLARAVGRRLNGDGRNMTRAQRRAFAELRDAFQADGMNATQVRDALRSFQQSGFDDATLLDAGGQNVQRLVRAAGTRGGVAGENLQNLLERRLETQAQRVSDRLSSGLSRSGNFSQEVSDQVRQRAQQAAPLYARAFGDPAQPVTIPRENIQSVLDRVPRNASAVANRLARLDGRGVGSLADDAVQVQDLHYLKMGLDDLISSSRRGQNSIGNTQRAGLERVRRELMDAMPDDYRAANDAFAGDSALIDALRAGRTALRGDAEDVEAIVSGMSLGERQMFRAGLVRSAREQVERARDRTDIVSRVIGSQDRRRRLASAFDTPEDFANFEQSLRNEQARVRNARAVAPTTGSQTALREADLAEDAGGVLGDLSNMDFGNAAARVVRGVRGATDRQARRATDQELVRFATALQSRGSGPSAELLLQEVERRYGRETAQRVAAMAARAIPVAAPVAASTAVNQ